MTTNTTTPLSVSGTLKAVTPKHQTGTEYLPGTYQQVPKGNTLELLISVKVPSPQPPQPFDQWEGWKGRWDAQQTMQALVRDINKELATAPKNPKGGHWFEPTPEDEATEAKPAGVCRGHAKCGNLAADETKCKTPPTLEERRAAAQAKVDELSAKHHTAKSAAYAEYFESCRQQTQLAMLASLGSGMFFALLGQELKVDFAPSDRVFQPMLEAAQNIAGALPASTEGAEIPSLAPPKLTFAAADDEYRDEGEAELEEEDEDE